jgi:hypothetical protein
MTATYQLSVEELSAEFFRKLKKFHPNASITLTVDNLDETDFLLKNPKNREILMQSLAQAEAGNLIKVNLENLNQKQ